MEGLKIVGLTILAAIVFGVLHDQVTARICVEYFTIGHPPIFGDLKSPTLLALGWGVVATWWAGAMIGLPLAIVSRIGSWPKLVTRDLVRPLGVLFAVMAISAAAMGTLAWHKAGPWFSVVPEAVPEGQRVGFVADAFAHLASYLAGFLGGMLLWIYVLVRRWRARRAAGEETDSA